MAMDFKLSDEFVDAYRDREVPWGYKDGAGNSLGELTYLRTYSRLKEDGTKETWVDTCRRVIEGMFTIQKRHCRQNRIEWKNDKAQRTAKDAFERLFTFKWLPAGRGLFAGGTPIVMDDGNSAPLQSCAFASTGTGIVEAMEFLFDASMLGVGVGFDTDASRMNVSVEAPELSDEVFVIPDSREGWVESLGVLMRAYLEEGKRRTPLPSFDYSLIRPAGEHIKRFGGTASGPEPLKRMHALIKEILDKRVGNTVTLEDITDFGNIIATCVISGSTRRSAELVLNDFDDPNLDNFLDLKNPEAYPDRQGWSWTSNNSVRAKVGDDFSKVTPGIMRNGEPGIMWLDVAQKYGRLKDAPDFKDAEAQGANPCLEQILFNYETCNLIEVFLNNIESQDDFIKTLKVAYLYGKTITLLPTKWERTNTVMQRNRRIGMSVSGIADYVDSHDLHSLRNMLDDGYRYSAKLDTKYSNWLCVRESIRRTTCKPSGSISLLAGASPGVHWTPGGKYFIRRITFSKTNPLFLRLLEAGYTHEDLEHDTANSVILFPIKSKSQRSASQVAAWEKIHLASELQHWWSDNAVSCTVDFGQDEAKDIPTLISMYDGKLKGISFLPRIDKGAYKHMPYEEISEEEYLKMSQSIQRIDFHESTENEEAVGEKFCTTDVCEIKVENSNSNMIQTIEISPEDR